MTICPSEWVEGSGRKRRQVCVCMHWCRHQPLGGGSAPWRRAVEDTCQLYRSEALLVPHLGGHAVSQKPLRCRQHLQRPLENLQALLKDRDERRIWKDEFWKDVCGGIGTAVADSEGGVERSLTCFDEWESVFHGRHTESSQAPLLKL